MPLRVRVDRLPPFLVIFCWGNLFKGNPQREGVYEMHSLPRQLDNIQKQNLPIHKRYLRLVLVTSEANRKYDEPKATVVN